MSTNANKKAITQIVRDYIKLAPKEYQAIKTLVAQKRADAKTKFGEMEGSDTEMRSMVEIPETLHAMFKTKLDEDTLKWLRDKEGLRWFTRTFKEFSRTELV